MAEISEVTAGLLDYVSYDTQSENDRESIPSTKEWFELAHKPVEKPKELGASRARMSEQGYVYACIPSNLEKGKISLAPGFIVHVDTTPSFPGKDTKPQFIRGYDGQDICLNKKQDIWMRIIDFPSLKEYEGKTLVTADGTTLLEADNKVGIAEVMIMATYFLRHPEVKHGATCIGFTPDEEMGRETGGLDMEDFGTNVTYTVDGGVLGELEYENFNAVSGGVTVHGTGIHPGTTRGRIRNALLMAVEFRSLLPADENPVYTEGYEGFYYLDRITGCMEEARMGYIIRDHDRIKSEHKKELFTQAVGFPNRKYGSGTVEVVVKGSYYNTKKKIKPHVGLIDKARASMEELGIRPIVVPIRGGTDGTRPSYMGLSYPNLCIGGYSSHGKYELIPVQPMEKITELLIKIARSFVETITDSVAGLCLPDAPTL